MFEAVIIGSLFFDMPKTSDGIFLRGGVLFFMLLFNALLALAELTRTLLSTPPVIDVANVASQPRSRRVRF